jgi:glycerol-3-phosphate O-acyltransferase
VLEDRTQLRAGDAEAPRTGRMAAAWRTLRFVGTQVGLLLRSRWHRFGYACVNFGTPVSVRAWAAQRGVDFDHLTREQRQVEVAALGRHLMDEVGRLIPVLPVPLVAAVLLAQEGRPLGELELKSAVATLVARLQQRDARLYLPRSDWDYAVTSGLRMLEQRHLVERVDGLLRARDDELPLLRYYANSIAHMLTPPAAA